MSIFAAVPFIPRKITHRGGCSYTSAALTFGRPRPNALGKTIWIRHGSRFRLGEKAGTVASALVLRRDAQNVRKRSTPAKVQMRLPGLVWGGVAMEAALGRKRLVSLRYIQLGKVRAAARIGCPF